MKTILTDPRTYFWLVGILLTLFLVGYGFLRFMHFCQRIAAEHEAWIASLSPEERARVSEQLMRDQNDSYL